VQSIVTSTLHSADDPGIGGLGDGAATGGSGVGGGGDGGSGDGGVGGGGDGGILPLSFCRRRFQNSSSSVAVLVFTDTSWAKTKHPMQTWSKMAACRENFIVLRKDQNIFILTSVTKSGSCKM
jgi:hypothetical protein